jgi:hypothetical protein
MMKLKMGNATVSNVTVVANTTTVTNATNTTNTTVADPMFVIPINYEFNATMQVWNDRLGRYLSEAGSASLQVKYSLLLGCAYVKMVAYNGQGKTLQTAIQAQCAAVETTFYSYGSSAQGTCTSSVATELEDPIDDIYQAMNNMTYMANATVAWNSAESFHLKYNLEQNIGVYYDSDLVVRYVTMEESYGTLVFDLGTSGIVDKNFTSADFTVTECSATTQPAKKKVLGSTTTISVPSELYMEYNEYSIAGSVLTKTSETTIKLSTIYNSMYTKMDTAQMDAEMVYNGTSGVLLMAAYGMCFQQSSDVVDMGLLVAALQLGFNNGTYLGTGTLPYASINDATTYHRAYIADGDMDVYYSQTTNTIKYVVVYDETTQVGSLIEYSDKSFVATTFTASDFTLSQCNAQNT